MQKYRQIDVSLFERMVSLKFLRILDDSNRKTLSLLEFSKNNQL